MTEKPYTYEGVRYWTQERTFVFQVTLVDFDKCHPSILASGTYMFGWRFKSSGQRFFIEISCLEFHTRKKESQPNNFISSVYCHVHLVRLVSICRQAGLHAICLEPIKRFSVQQSLIQRQSTDEKKV